jgi:hypothetical protein
MDRMFTPGQRVVQIVLVDAAKRAQKMAGGCPQAFAGVGGDLADAIAVVIPRPFVLPMPHGVMGARDPGVSLPFLCLTGGVLLGVALPVLLPRLPVGMVPDPQAPLPPVAPPGADTRRPIVVVPPMPARLVSAPPWWLKRVGGSLTFFPPHADTSPPSPCRDPVTLGRLTSPNRGLGVACANAKRPAVSGRVPQLRRSPVRPYQPRVLTTRHDGPPSYSPQRGCLYTGCKFAGSGGSDNPQSRAWACATRAPLPALRRSEGSAALWHESSSPSTPDFPVHQGIR